MSFLGRYNNNSTVHRPKCNEMWDCSLWDLTELLGNAGKTMASYCKTYCDISKNSLPNYRKTYDISKRVVLPDHQWSGWKPPAKWWEKEIKLTLQIQFHIPANKLNLRIFYSQIPCQLFIHFCKPTMQKCIDCVWGADEHVFSPHFYNVFNGLQDFSYLDVGCCIRNKSINMKNPIPCQTLNV